MFGGETFSSQRTVYAVRMIDYRGSQNGEQRQSSKLVWMQTTKERVKIVNDAPLLAAIRYEAGFDINRTLREAVMLLRGRGFEIGGVLQEAEAEEDSFCSGLNIVDIRSGDKARITQERGKHSRGCKLDPRGLAEISHCIKVAIDTRVDLIIINKFGRAESENGGLLSCITDAATAGIPVLTTVRKPYLKSWDSFHGGLAIELQPCVNSILKWFDSTRELLLNTPRSVDTTCELESS